MGGMALLYRLTICGDPVPIITDMPTPDLAKFLSRFVLEVRKKNGDLFLPNTWHHIVSGLQRHLRQTSSSTFATTRNRSKEAASRTHYYAEKENLWGKKPPGL